MRVLQQSSVDETDERKVDEFLEKRGRALAMLIKILGGG
jgi:hypothetical protein